MQHMDVLTRQVKPVLSSKESLSLAQQKPLTQFSDIKKYDPKIVNILRIFMHSLSSEAMNILHNKRHIKGWQLMLATLTRQHRDIITRQVKPVLSSKEAIGLAQQKLPTQFSGIKKYDPKIANILRTFMHSLSPAEMDNILYSEQHINGLEPMLATLKEYIQTNSPTLNPNNSVAAKFLEEIALRKNNITFSWIMLIHLRYAAAVANLSREEIIFLAHTFNAKFFKGLFIDNAFNDHATTVNRIGKSFIYEDAEREMWFKKLPTLNEEVRKYLPAQITYPLIGVGNIGLTFMLSCYLDNIFLCGLPYGKISAHGIILSPVSFATHDKLHAEIDPRYQVLEYDIIHATKKFIKKGGKAEDFIKYYTPLASARYLVLMQAFKALIQSFLTNLLPTYHPQEYKKALAGLFLILHEYARWDIPMLRSNDLEKTLNLMLKYSLKHQTRNTLEKATNPLATSPIDGASTLTDQQIVQIALTSRLIHEILFNMYPSEMTTNERRIKFLNENIDTAEVIRNKDFIDVIFTMKNQQRFTYKSHTLHYKWSNMDDLIAILKMCGCNITKPELDASLPLEKTYQIVAKTMNLVQKGIAAIMQDFNKKAIFFINLQTSPQKSLRDKYFTLQFNLEKKITEASEKILAKQKLPKEFFFK